MCVIEGRCPTEDIRQLILELKKERVYGIDPVSEDTSFAPAEEFHCMEKVGDMLLNEKSGGKREFERECV